LLSKKVGINDAKELMERILARCSALDMKAMANDVQPFLFNPADPKKVLFAEYLNQVKLK